MNHEVSTTNTSNSLNIKSSVDSFHHQNYVFKPFYHTNNYEHADVTLIQHDEFGNPNVLPLIHENKTIKLKVKNKIVHSYNTVDDVLTCLSKYLSVDDTTNLKQLYFGEEHGCANCFYNLYKDSIKIVDPKSNDMYVWDEDTALWKATPFKHLITIFSELMIYYIQKLYNKIIDVSNIISRDTNDDGSENFDTLLEIIMEKISNLERNMHKSSCVSACIRFLPKKLHDRQFITKVNSIKYLMPINPKKVIDLTSGNISERTMHHYFSEELNVVYNPEADNTVVSKFLNDITLDNIQHQEFLQVVLGSSLTGDISNNKFYIFYGDGSNGKSLLFKLLSSIIGSYFRTVDKGVFFNIGSKSIGSASPHLISIMGRRIIVYNESESGDKLSEGTIKALTGGDEITARGLYQDEITFRPMCIPFMLTNNIPEFEVIYAMVRRLVFFPFMAKFVIDPKSPSEKPLDVNLEDKLLQDNNKSAFLNWLIKGAAKWYQGNRQIHIPNDIQTICDEKFTERDEYQLFIDDCFYIADVEKLKYHYVSGNQLYNTYKDWCFENNRDPVKSSKFASSILPKLKYILKVEEKYIKIKRSSYYYHGLIPKNTHHASNI